jgi:hypothetical protein
MRRQLQTILVAGVILIATAAVGASAFTSATVERQTTASVTTDENSLLGLSDGNSGNLVYQDATTGQLVINMTNGTAGGINTDAPFTLGDTANPASTYAFSVTNNDAEAHQIHVAYALTNDDSDSSENLKFQIYDSSETLVGTVTEEGGTVAIDADPAETFTVVLSIDTGHGAAGTLTSADDLSGTLSFTADDVAEGGTVSDGS